MEQQAVRRSADCFKAGSISPLGQHSPFRGGPLSLYSPFSRLGSLAYLPAVAEHWHPPKITIQIRGFLANSSILQGNGPCHLEELYPTKGIKNVPVSAEA